MNARTQSLDVEQLMHVARQHHDADRLTEAEGLCLEVLKRRPDHAGACQLLGILACRAKQFDRGISLLSGTGGLRDCAGLAEVALSLATAGDPDAAIGLLGKVIDLHPSEPATLHHQGNLLQRAGRLEAAVTAYRRAIAIGGTLTETHCNLGVALNSLGRIDDAIAAHRRAIELQPGRAELHANLGAALASADRWDEAIEAYQAAINLNPDFADAHYNFGNALRAMGKLEQAIAAYQLAIRIKPEFAEAHGNLGIALRSQGRLAESIASHEVAIQFAPESPEPHWNRAVTLLLAGDLQRGWVEYEWRHRQPWARPRQFAQPGWDGSELSGRTILLHAEQGLGDTIQFVRYVRRVAERGGVVILECQPELRELLEGLSGAAKVVSQGQPFSAFDLHCPLMSLPRILDTRLGSIPNEVPYLWPGSALVKAWGNRVSPRDDCLKVGLAWAGRPEHGSDRQRSMSLTDLAPLLREARGVDFYSLQKGPAAEQARASAVEIGLIDLTPELRTFADTAALISHLDLVISVDTAVAHLAGAMGKPVWLLLPLVPDWRWMLNREDSPWYPTMRLFRQTRIGRWIEPLEDMVRDLHSFRRKGIRLPD